MSIRFFFSVIVSCLNAAEYELATGVEGNLSWRSEDSWYLNPGKGDPLEHYPTSGDDVIIPNQYGSENFALFLQLPTGVFGEEIEINSLSANVECSVSLIGQKGVSSFVVKSDFIKAGEINIKDEKTVAAGQGHFAVVPRDLKTYLNVRIDGNVYLRDKAENRTSYMIFGGSSYWGGFNVGHLLASLNLKKDLNISNILVFILVIRGRVRTEIWRQIVHFSFGNSEIFCKNQYK